MSSQWNQVQDQRTEVPLYIGTDATTQLKVNQTAVVLTTDTTQTVKLPPVAEAKGRFYGFTKLAGAGSNACTVDDFGDDPAFAGATIQTDSASGLYYSDGIHWHILE